MAIEKTPLSAVISEHWEAMQQQSMLIPEWKLDGEPIEIYFNPPNLRERDTLRRYSGNEFLAETLILKATTKTGEKLFTKADKPRLMDGASPAVVARIAERILMADSIDVERLGEP